MLHGERAAAIGPVKRHLVAARRGYGDVPIRPDFLVAAPDQAIAPWLYGGLAGVIAAVEGHALRLQPVEVRHTPVAVEAEFFRLRIGRQRLKVLVHFLGGILEAAGRLHRRTAAEIEVAAGDCGAASGAARALQHQHARAGLACTERGAGTC